MLELEPRRQSGSHLESICIVIEFFQFLFRVARVRAGNAKADSRFPSAQR